MISPPAIVQPAEEEFGMMRLMDAIAQVESGGDDAAVGSQGERGRFQFTEALWKEFSPMPFERANCRSCAEVTMSRLLLAWHHELVCKDVPMKMRAEIIVQWFECGRHGAVTPRKRDSIQRILNLYYAP